MELALAIVSLLLALAPVIVPWLGRIITPETKDESLLRRKREADAEIERMDKDAVNLRLESHLRLLRRDDIVPDKTGGDSERQNSSANGTKSRLHISVPRVVRSRRTDARNPSRFGGP